METVGSTLQERQIARLDKELDVLRQRVWGLSFKALHLTYGLAAAGLLILILLVGFALIVARLG